MKLFKCKKCGNIVEVIKEKGGTLTCCNESMEEVQINLEDQVKEKHVPYCDIQTDSVYIRIGEVEHPMNEEHYIEWIYVEYGDSIVKHIFKPGMIPEVTVDYEEGMKVYAYCNLHGLWKKEL